MTARGIPVQDLPENQDPEFAYVIDEVTGFKTVLPGGPLDKPAAKETGDEKPKRGRKAKAPVKEVGSVVTAEQVEVVEAAIEAAAAVELHDLDDVIAELEAEDSE